MIKKFILGLLLSVCLISPVMSLTNVLCTTVHAAESEGATTYNTIYEWYYKEINGVKFMRLWDNKNGVWVTNWIPV